MQLNGSREKLQEEEMPFLDNNGPDEEALRHPIWSVFALTKDNLERLIATNVFWSAQLIPAFCALAFPGLWIGPRVLLILGSATLLAASTGVLYGMMKAVCEYEILTIELLGTMIRTLALPGLRKLAPLYGTFGLCLVAIMLSPLIPGAFLIQVLLSYLALTLVFCSFYWGPLFAADPTASIWTLFKRSVHFAWRYPGRTLVSWLAILLVLVPGVLSIVGLMLIVPALVALLQTRRYQELGEHERERRKTRKGLMV
jgi:hypothetical protein